MTLSDMDSTRGHDGVHPDAPPDVGDEIEMRAPYGPGWIRAIVTRVVIVPTLDVGDVALVAASGHGPGPHVVSFWPSEHFRAVRIECPNCPAVCDPRDPCMCDAACPRCNPARPR